MNVDIRLKIFSYTRTISISRYWFQYGIMTAAIVMGIVVSMAAAFLGNQMILILVLAAVAGTVGVLLLMRYPNLGFIVILVSGMFIPFSGPGGVNASILSVILVMGLWLMDMFIVKREFEFIKSRTLRPVFYFMLISILAFAIGQIPWFVFANQAPMTAQLGGFAIYFFLLATMIMTANMIRDIRWLQTIVWVFVGLGMVYVIGRALEIPLTDRIYQAGFYANSMFWMWLVALPLSQAMFNKLLSLRVRILLYGIVALTFLVALLQQGDWKSGWLPAAVVAGVLFSLRFKRLVILAVPFIAVGAVIMAQDLISTDLYSWGTRLDAWAVVLDISRADPILGLGFANYYWYAELFPIRGYRINFNSHSQFVDIIAQTGILGLICYVWILFEVGRLALNLLIKLPDGFAKGYAYGVFGGVFGAIMASFLVDWVLPFAYNIGLNGVRASILPWIFFGGLVSINQIYFGTRSKGQPVVANVSKS